jgi:hypothetical protein
MQLSRIILIISNVLVIGMLGWLLYNGRKPLCIDSKVVEKIDIVTSHGREVVYSCNQRKFVPFSPYLHEMLPHIKDRVRDVETLTKVIGPLGRPVKLEILFNKPWLFEVMDHSVYMGEQMFLAEGHLEKALLKVWYREKRPETFAYSQLAEETMTDFLLYLAKGDIEFEDRYQGLRTKLGGARWPHVLKSIQSYCDSPWKTSEHFNICISGKHLPEFIGENLLQLSLRPLLSSSMIESYQELPFAQKNEFLKNIGSFISSPRNPPLDILGAHWDLYPSSILMGQEILKTMQEYVFRSSMSQTMPSYKLMASYLTENLRQKGFQEASSEVYFDFIYETQDTMDVSSPVFANLQALSEARQDIQIAVIDSKNIWFLPSRYSLDLNLFKEIKSRQRIVDMCGNFDFGFVKGYAQKTEKLMVIQSCGKYQPQKIESYIKDGPEGFARNNKQIQFVQFHLPSLLSRSEQIPSEESVINLVQNRDVNSPIIQALGWQELRWEKSVEAYRPKAQIEAIQWFRF